jgi:hypothetical protein
MSSKELDDKDADDLLAEIVGSAPRSEPVQQSIQVLFVPPKNQPQTGGRALGNSRPRNMARNRPSQEDLEYYEALSEEREQFVAGDAVVQNSSGKDPLALLSALKKEVARETACLAYQRMVNERTGRDTSAISGRRIDALKKIADIELEMHKIGFEQLDLYSEKLQRVFQLWTEIVKDAAVATLGPEQLDLFFNRLTTAMDGWEERAEDLIR